MYQKKTVWIDVSFFYKTGINSDDIWIQVDFLENKLIKGVATQGRGEIEILQWVKSYHVKYRQQNIFEYVKDSFNQPLVSLILFWISVNFNVALISWFFFCCLRTLH